MHDTRPVLTRSFIAALAVELVLLLDNADRAPVLLTDVTDWLTEHIENDGVRVQIEELMDALAFQYRVERRIP